MTLEQDIQSAIEKQLPGEVGTILKQRLEQAEKDAARVAQLEVELESIRNMDQHHRNELSKHSALDTREASLDEREAVVKDAELRKELGELRVTLAGERLTDMKQLVLAVFANNRYKYWETENASVPVAPSASGMYPTQQTETRSKTIETEG